MSRRKKYYGVYAANGFGVYNNYYFYFYRRKTAVGR